MPSCIRSFCDKRNTHSIAKAFNVISTMNFRQFQADPILPYALSLFPCRSHSFGNLLVSLPLYPASASARDRFVAERRAARPSHDLGGTQGLIVEDERTGEGVRARTATVLLTGRECPWRCATCDLWRYTTVADTPSGAIAAQVAAAVAALHEEQPRVSVIKLYNAGSFFDPRAVPVEDYDTIAATLAGFSRVVVECTPR